MHSCLFKCLVLVGAVCGVYSYGSGAPSRACVSLMPGHYGISPQSATSPYSITVSSSTYQPNQQITVTISGGNHQGLLLQARVSGATTPIGTFSTPSANTKTIQCTAAGDSWTHSSQTMKTTSTVIWTAPSADAGQISFKATIAQNKNTYWMNHESQALTFIPETTMSSTNVPTTTDTGSSVSSANVPTTTESSSVSSANVSSTSGSVNDPSTTGSSNLQTTTDSGGSVIRLGVGSVLAVAISAFYVF
ncbi:hypothetical protein SNE40_022794 [Patella caerulea]|uniref:Reelin domain-containing protein n=1 Tax=Patella caerulea TaxID=87958 RepID=A0AAN8FX15_PATCE